MLIWSAKIPGKAPSTNHIYKRSGRSVYMPKEVVDFRLSVQEIARYTYSGQLLTCNLRVEVLHMFADNRRRDATNYHKVLFDALEKIIYKDDKQLIEVLLRIESGTKDCTDIKIFSFDNK